MPDAPPVDIVDKNRITVIEVSTEWCDGRHGDAKVRSYLYAKLPSGRTLSYCYHHANVFHDALVQSGATIIDNRHILDEEEAAR